MHPVLPIIPLHRRRFIPSTRQQILKPTKPLLIATQHHLIRTLYLDPDPIIRKALCRVEIEHEQESSALVHDKFVDLVFERDICLWRGEPVILRVEVVHGGVKRVEVSVPEDRVVDDVPLATGIVEGVAVAFAREIQPLWIFLQ